MDNNYITSSPWVSFSTTADCCFTYGGDYITALVDDVATIKATQSTVELNMSDIRNLQEKFASLEGEIYVLKCEVENLKKEQNKRLSKMDTRINGIIAFFQKLGIKF